MKITMREAIMQGKDFDFEGVKYENTNGAIYENGVPMIYLNWVLENQDKLVEVEIDYWDSDGRAIRELKDGIKFWAFRMIESDFIVEEEIWESHGNDKIRFLTGSIFKDKASAQSELQRLKDLQKGRMEKK